MKSIYLDYAAATPVDSDAIEAMLPYLGDKFYNPSATYNSARSVRLELQDLHHRAAQILGCRPAEIIFTSGATESNNLALQGVHRAIGGNMLVSAIEHKSVLEPAQDLGATIIPVDENGTIDIAWVSAHLNGVTLVSVMLVNNEIGAIQPIKQLGILIEEERRQRLKKGDKTPIYFHTDAAQAVNYLDVHVSRLGADLMSINGGKIFGPKGAGLLYVKAGIKIEAIAKGGAQEFGLRSGTENLSGLAGLVAAFEKASTNRATNAEYVTQLRHKFEKLVAASTKEVKINGGKQRAPHISSICFPGQDNETLMIKLDELGVQCAVGSACSASSEEPSQTLKAIGLTDDQAKSTLRFSFSSHTTEEDIAKASEILLSQL